MHTLNLRSHFAAKPGVVLVKHKNSSAVAYVWDHLGVPRAVGFSGRRDKADYNFRFRNAAEREARIKNEFERVQAREAYKAMQKAKTKTEGRGLEVGDILYSTWGYEQTNVDFYKVVKLVGSTMVEIRKLGAKIVRTDSWASGAKVPTDEFTSAETLRKVARGGRVGLTSYSSAGKWDGKPISYSEWH